MEKNMSKKDRVLRSVISLAMIILSIYLVIDSNIVAGLILMLLAGILSITSISGCCPMYLPFGFTTLRTSSARIMAKTYRDFDEKQDENEKKTEMHQTPTNN